MEFIKSNIKTSVEVLDDFIPIVIISKVALSKMQLYVENCQNEIGWLGVVTKTNDSLFIVEDVYLFKQNVHMATTEITPEGLSEFAEDLLSQPDGIDIWNNIRLWGHSHVNMSTSPSKQDNDQMLTFAQGGHPWFLRIIANKKGNISIDLYDYSQGIIYKNLNWWVELTEEEKLIDKQIAILQAKAAAIKNKVLDFYKEPIIEEIKNKVSSIRTYGHVHTSNSIQTTNLFDLSDWYNEQDDGSIKTIADVYAIFDDTALLEIAQCKTFVEAKQVLAIYGYEYDYNEIQLIWKTAKDNYGSKVGY